MPSIGGGLTSRCFAASGEGGTTVTTITAAVPSMCSRPPYSRVHGTDVGSRKAPQITNRWTLLSLRLEGSLCPVLQNFKVVGHLTVLCDIAHPPQSAANRRVRTAGAGQVSAPNDVQATPTVTSTSSEECSETHIYLQTRRALPQERSGMSWPVTEVRTDTRAQVLDAPTDAVLVGRRTSDGSQGVTQPEELLERVVRRELNTNASAKKSNPNQACDITEASAGVAHHHAYGCEPPAFESASHESQQWECLSNSSGQPSHYVYSAGKQNEGNEKQQQRSPSLGPSVKHYEVQPEAEETERLRKLHGRRISAKCSVIN
ncbi:hypothetical protein HPB48_022744 [Haemaphysalis longicornis]|uniref:Uncharacterized protein n=1 Tax=Haemaphysalis longicornis TaxID=44386 RepID=A0A9J6FX58_HAELO|nr:hypothetical protein HPB48_022744 [Haemaphysalis longicornis]